MPLQVLQFRPGVSRESTSYANEGAWYQCDKIRFRSGLPEKLGGWAAQGEYFNGVCRNITEWVSNAGIQLLGIGTNQKYYIYSGGVYYNITPYRFETVLPDPFYPIYSTLNASIGADDTSFDVVDGTSFTSVYPYVIKIDNELIYVGAATGNTLANCIRGYAGTTAAPHSAGAAVSSSYMVVYSPSNGATIGDYVTFSAATAFGPYSITDLNAEYRITEVTTDYILFDIGVYSTSATGGGGSVDASYQISPGNAVALAGGGWGAGPWVSMEPNIGDTILSATITATATTASVVSTITFGGVGSSGYAQIESEIVGYVVASGTTLTITRSSQNPSGHMAGAAVTEVAYEVGTHPWNQGYISFMRLWSSDNFGQDLVYCPANSAIYYWSAPLNLDAAGAVTGPGIDILEIVGADGYAPTKAIGILVTDERHIVAFGSTDTAIPGSTDQNPLMISWCSQEAPGIWDPSDITNTAGNLLISYGSKIIGWQKTRQEILIWSDSALYSMRYLGPPYVYGINPISVDDVSIASRNAMITAGGITYWMGIDKFYAYSGRVDTLPCALRQYIFDDINNNQLDQVYAGSNEKYNEVWWLYCSEDATYPDKYVIYNYLEKLWYYGTIERTAWYDSHIKTYPLATSYDPATELGRLFYHEFGTDDGSTNPVSAINAYIESADFDIGDGGNQFSFVKRIIPDVDFIGSSNTTPSVTMTLQARNFPGIGVITSPMQDSNTAISGTKVTTQVYNYTNQAWVRLRGRQVIFRVESDSIGTKWQLGTPRLDLQPDGRR